MRVPVSALCGAGRAGGNHALVVIALAFLVGACDSDTDAKQALTYSKNGISFSYPSNWSVEDDHDPTDGSSRTLSVGTEDFSVTVVRIGLPAALPPDQLPALLTLEGFFEQHSEFITEKMRAQASGAIPVRRVVAGSARDGLERTVEAKLLKQKVSFRIQAFRVESAAVIAFLFVMVAVEDWTSTRPGVELVLASFRLE
jgi:hypothetical protein